jgi:hypothetical protein
VVEEEIEEEALKQQMELLLEKNQWDWEDGTEPTKALSR